MTEDMPDYLIIWAFAVTAMIVILSIIVADILIQLNKRKV